MKTCIAVFRSKTEVYEFVDAMRFSGAMASIINTPKEAHVGCGISAKISDGLIHYAKSIITRYRLTSFYGFFIVEKRGDRTTTVRI